MESEAVVREMDALAEYVRSTCETINNWRYEYVPIESIQHFAKDVPQWAWIAAAAVGCTVCFKLHYEWYYGVWKRQNIPGPTPLPVLGNNHLLATCKDLNQLNIDLCSKYGKRGYFGLVQVLVMLVAATCKCQLRAKFQQWKFYLILSWVFIKNSALVLNVLIFASWLLFCWKQDTWLTPAFAATWLKIPLLLTCAIVKHQHWFSKISVTKLLINCSSSLP